MVGGAQQFDGSALLVERQAPRRLVPVRLQRVFHAALHGVEQAHGRDGHGAGGIRRGADAIDKSVTLIDRLLDAESVDGPGMEPRDVAALLRAQASLVAELRALREHTGRTKLARLTRDKTRAEIELLRGKIAGTHVDRVSLEHLTDDDVDARLAALAGLTAPDDEGAAAGDAGAPRGEGAEGEDS